MSTLFDLFGFAGAFFAGFVSDRLFQGRRTVISILMLVGMVIGCCVLFWAGTMVDNPAFGPDTVLFVCGAGLSIIGFMLFGPDSAHRSRSDGFGIKKIGTCRSGNHQWNGLSGFHDTSVLPKVMEYSKNGVSFAGIQLTATESTFAVLILASALSIFPLLIVHLRNKQGKSDL